VRLVQKSKAPAPMLVTEFGIVTAVRDEQPMKVEASILVIVFGIETEVR
jgi:hypothetical protein